MQHHLEIHNNKKKIIKLFIFYFVVGNKDSDKRVENEYDILPEYYFWY